jgi:glycogen synthase
MTTKLAFVTYETPFAPSGGIAAVMGRLPASVKSASQLEVVVLTPFHHKISKTSALATVDAGDTVVTYGGNQLKVNLKRYDADGISWYFLQPEHPKVFSGFPHPYLVGKTREEIASVLLRDSLVFGTSVISALKKLDTSANWILFLQDWEAATSALALSGQEQEWRLFATLHNSYDSPVTDAELAAHGISARGCPGKTVLSRAIPLLEDTVFTVSDQFAQDFTEDEFQSRVMADHLQGLLRPRLLGVNNGPFVDLAVDRNALASAILGDYRRLAEWKADNRNKAISALKQLSPSPEKPLWGDLKKFKHEETACWFVMAGRDDTRQKGYDVAAAGVRRFLSRGGDARFFFFPIPGDEGLDGLSFLSTLAKDFPAHVLVFPFIWREGFFATLQGASFGLMPSFYEPFGMANEFYLNGTVGIGRMTGGIIQQIVPLRSVSCFSHAAEMRASRWHSSSAHPTGLLFRERDDPGSSISDWRLINAANYVVGTGSPNRVEDRNQCSLFRSMAEELSISLDDAINLFANDVELYYSMLTEGIGYIQRSFSWRRTAHEYLRTVSG